VEARPLQWAVLEEEEEEEVETPPFRWVPQAELPLETIPRLEGEAARALRSETTTTTTTPVLVAEVAVDLASSLRREENPVAEEAEENKRKNRESKLHFFDL
jgi:hypothetical protein